MNKQEILEANRAIADSPFSGEAVKYEIAHHTDSGNDIGLNHFYETLDYCENWGRLMNVVDNIEKWGVEFVISTGSIIITWDDGTTYYDREFVGTRNKRHVLFPMIAKFAKWYQSESEK